MLPPTPIANPGREAMEAVPIRRGPEDFYFVADGTGGHAFAETLDEHNSNVARLAPDRSGARKGWPEKAEAEACGKAPKRGRRRKLTAGQPRIAWRLGNRGLQPWRSSR
jgi:UPF0755 protein